MTSVTTRTFEIEHVTVVSSKSFDDTRAAFEKALGRFDEAIFARLGADDVAGALEAMENLEPLVIAGERNHGALLRTVGLERRAIQYDCGNALVATRMTRHRLSAAMYAPIRVLLREIDGEVAFEYDRPGSLFGQFDDAEVTAVTRRLDSLFEETLRAAAS
ncbi:DUF302 domain-containing protein [Streptomyces sp. NPDC026672]|uniref:DUF302 domain-containing protein n=1 Tax=unclassified Streptomyces TaxID=2593676 RepID=UPI00340D829A